MFQNPLISIPLNEKLGLLNIHWAHTDTDRELTSQMSLDVTGHTSLDTCDVHITVWHGVLGGEGVCPPVTW